MGQVGDLVCADFVELAHRLSVVSFVVYRDSILNH